MASSPNDDMVTIQRQYDWVITNALKDECKDYRRHLKSEKKRGVPVVFSQLSEQELNAIYVEDEYLAENDAFKVCGYDIYVKDDMLVEALRSLSKRKREVVLLYYYMDMTDAEIGAEMKLQRNSVERHRAKALEMMKKKMEDLSYGKKRK